MATAVRTMTLSQNMMIPNNNNNCVILSANMFAGNKPQIPMYGKRPIAPAPNCNSVLTANGANQVINLPKKKFNYAAMQYPATQTQSVQRRNARERNRVKQVNNGFSNLRQHIPQNVITTLTKGGRGASKKLSKVDTLRLAVEYIRGLKDLLDDTENSESTSAGSSSSSSYYSDKSQHLLQSLPRSEASLSPTPSYVSEASSTMSYTPNLIQGHQINFKQEPFDTYVEQSTTPSPSYHSEVMHHHQQIFPPASTPYKQIPHHHYENYSPVSADDDELLDAIAWWQTQ